MEQAKRSLLAPAVPGQDRVTWLRMFQGTQDLSNQRMEVGQVSRDRTLGASPVGWQKKLMQEDKGKQARPCISSVALSTAGSDGLGGP